MFSQGKKHRSIDLDQIFRYREKRAKMDEENKNLGMDNSNSTESPEPDVPHNATIAEIESGCHDNTGKPNSPEKVTPGRHETKDEVPANVRCPYCFGLVPGVQLHSHLEWEYRERGIDINKGGMKTEETGSVKQPMMPGQSSTRDQQPSTDLTAGGSQANHHNNNNMITQPGWGYKMPIFAPLISSGGPTKKMMMMQESCNWCAKCSATFRLTSDLVQHMRTNHKIFSANTEEVLSSKRPISGRRGVEKSNLKCTVCGEAFRERHHLTRHMSSHASADQ